MLKTIDQIIPTLEKHIFIQMYTHVEIFLKEKITSTVLYRIYQAIHKSKLKIENYINWIKHQMLKKSRVLFYSGNI